MIDDDQEIFYSSMKTGSSGIDDPNPSYRTDRPDPYDRFSPSFDAEEGAASTMSDYRALDGDDQLAIAVSEGGDKLIGAWGYFLDIDRTRGIYRG